MKKINREKLPLDKKAIASMYNFIINTKELEVLLIIYSKYSRKKVGWRYSPEILKRASIILLITAWETVIEDLILLETQKRIRAAKSPKDVITAFNRCANKWLSETKPKPPELIIWAGNNWKRLLVKELEIDISEINTPNSKNIRKLSHYYLGTDITKFWKWRGITQERNCNKLDKLIELRGNIVHKGKDYIFEKKDKVTRRYVKQSIELIQNLACKTADGLHIPVPDIPISKFTDLFTYLHSK